MSLSATGNAYSAQKLQTYIQQAQTQGLLPRTEGLQANGESISLAQLEQQCQGHPALEGVVQEFIKTQDNLQMSGNSTQSYEFTQQASFDTPQATQPDPVQQLQSLRSEQEQLRDDLKQAKTFDQRSTISKRIGALELQIRDLRPEAYRQANRHGQDLVNEELKDPSKWKNLQEGSPLNQVLGAIADDAGSITGTKNQDFANSLDINQGQSFVYAMLLSRPFNQIEIEKLSVILAKCEAGADAGGEVTQADQQALHTIGLHFKDGKLHNIMTQQPLDPTVLTHLRETVESFRGIDENGVTTQSQALHHLQGVMKNALSKSEALAAARQQLEQKVGELESATGDLAHQQNELQQQTAAVREIQERQEVKQQEVQEVVQLFGATGSPADLAASLQQMEPAQITQTNELLARYNLSVSKDEQGQIHYSINGEEKDQASFWTAFQHGLSRQQGELAELNTSADHMLETVRVQEVTVRQAEVKVESLQQDVGTQTEVLQKARDAARLALDQAQDVVASPEVQKLPAPLRRAGERVLRRLQTHQERENREAPSFMDRLRSIREKAKDAVNKAREARSEATQTVRQAGPRLTKRQKIDLVFQNLQNRMGEYVKKLAKLPTKTLQQAEISSQLEAKVQELKAVANELQAKLQLARAPNYEGLEEVAKQLEDVLKESQAVFQNLYDTQNELSSSKQKISNDHCIRLRDNSEYHARKLSELHNHSHQEIALAASAALKQLRGDFFLSSSLLAS
ncbi:MAG: hypothetical protein ACAI44_23425 [Candidatus Sericytochromatia bacterium]